MLIRTIDELEALPDGAIVRDAAGCACQKIGVSEHARGRVPEADAWERMGQPNRNLPHLPAQLIYPRRYGDDDVERVADAMRATPRCSIVYDEDGDPWCKDHDIEWFHDNARFPYGCQHQERAWARAALNALEGK